MLQNSELLLCVLSTLTEPQSLLRAAAACKLWAMEMKANEERLWSPMPTVPAVSRSERCGGGECG